MRNNNEELTSTFKSQEGKYRDLCNEISYSLSREIGSSGIKIHSISTRPKTLESFLEKVNRKQYADPFTQCEDLGAARVVCLFMSDLVKIREVIENTFQVLSHHDKIQDGDASSFGYMSQHYICRLSSENSGPRYDHIGGLKFEIQVRTILMDAWANISHYLSYKNEDSIPHTVTRDFHALSGLLFVADRQFELLADTALRSAANAENEIVHSGAEVSDINGDTLTALLLKLFSDRDPSSAFDVSDLVQDARNFGYTDLRDLSRDIEAGLPAALQDEIDDPPHAIFPDDKDDGRYNRVGIARTCLTHAKPEFLTMMRKKWGTRNFLEHEAELED
ncbi:GTP pyrophosphokinase [Streptomyces roseolus]|uniref:GTP pyrophosphokinase n=1 Tax=Streptomyces roseolus TaxID=67358 RepID=UPI0016759AC4|nr:hypothetical protein [Streptomyces roseolus]